MARLLFYALPLILMIYALADCIQDEDTARTNVAKPLWYVVIILVPVFGPVGWLVVSRMTRTEGSTRPNPPTRPAMGGPAAQRRPLAPDDDPEFLAALAREQRLRRQREARLADSPEESSDPPAKPEQKNGDTPHRRNSDSES